MRLPTQMNGRRPLQFNVTPLIDIVFLLIIFFLVASHFVRSEQAAAVDLPVASAANPDAEPTHRLTVTISADGTYSISGVTATSDQVLQRISELAAAAASDGPVPEVRLRADRHGRFGAIRPVIEACARQNIRVIQFAVSLEKS